MHTQTHTQTHQTIIAYAHKKYISKRVCRNSIGIYVLLGAYSEPKRNTNRDLLFLMCNGAPSAWQSDNKMKGKCGGTGRVPIVNNFIYSLQNSRFLPIPVWFMFYCFSFFPWRNALHIHQNILYYIRVVVLFSIFFSSVDWRIDVLYLWMYARAKRIDRGCLLFRI